MSELDNLESVVESKPHYREISIKYNPLFATENEIVETNSIIVNGKEIIKTRRKFWALFGLKFKYTVEDYKKEIKIEELKKGDIILIFESDYSDRWYDGEGHFIKLKPEKIDLKNYIEEKKGEK